MKEDYTIDASRARRFEKKLRRLGKKDPHCCQCGARDLRILRPIRVSEKAGLSLEIRCGNCLLKHKPITEAQRANRGRKIEAAGYPTAQCLNCHEDELLTLDLHHVAGAANSGWLVPLCENCHEIQSDMQQDFMRALLRREDDRRPLVLQAALEIGLALVLSAISSEASRKEGGAVVCVFFGGAALYLLAWGKWNVALDGHLAVTVGKHYCNAVPAAPAR